MNNTSKIKLLNYISKKNEKTNSAFTLGELIIVVIVIGILSLITVPVFRNASDKARQKESSSLLIPSSLINQPNQLNTINDSSKNKFKT